MLAYCSPHDDLWVNDFAFWLHGELDLPAFRQSVDVIVARHDALRQTFSTSLARPVSTLGPSTLRPSSDSSQISSTCSSLPLVFGCSDVAC